MTRFSNLTSYPLPPLKMTWPVLAYACSTWEHTYRSAHGTRQRTAKRPLDFGGFKNDPLREPAKPCVLTDKQ